MWRSCVVVYYYTVILSTVNYTVNYAQYAPGTCHATLGPPAVVWTALGGSKRRPSPRPPPTRPLYYSGGGRVGWLVSARARVWAMVWVGNGLGVHMPPQHEIERLCGGGVGMGPALPRRPTVPLKTRRSRDLGWRRPKWTAEPNTATFTNKHSSTTNTPATTTQVVDVVASQSSYLERPALGLTMYRRGTCVGPYNVPARVGRLDLERDGPAARQVAQREVLDRRARERGLRIRARRRARASARAHAKYRGRARTRRLAPHRSPGAGCAAGGRASNLSSAGSITTSAGDGFSAGSRSGRGVAISKPAGRGLQLMAGVGWLCGGSFLF